MVRVNKPEGGRIRAASELLSKMPRKPREEEAGAIHHVFARGVDRAVIFVDELDYERYTRLLIATVISELARNIVMYAKTGEIRLKVINGGSARHGIQVIARYEGPGIADVDQALRDGFSTSGSLGVGLPGVRRLVDEFQIDSTENRGTTVTVMKRKRPAVADRR